MTAADRDTLLTLVQQWRERAAMMRANSRDTVVESLMDQHVDATKRCADELTALLARLTPPDPETPQ